jgi:hypothetical protein
MENSEILAYVKAAARVVNMPIDDAAAQRVAAHLGRTAALARLLDQADLAPEHEPAEIYRPAQFPAESKP